MISANTHVLGRLSGNQVLVAKKQNPDDPASNKQKAVEELKSRDKEVRNHEAAHSTNPELIKIGSAQFDYTIGPDGKAYATGGKITLSTGNSKTPEEALSKAQALKKASMAPGEPSSQDFQALNAAVAMEFEAKNQIYSNRKKIDNGSLTLLKGSGLNIYA
jgi:hypothetical protein